MKNPNRKLVLHRETLRSLGSDQLSEVAGGTDSIVIEPGTTQGGGPRCTGMCTGYGCPSRGCTQVASCVPGCTVSVGGVTCYLC